MEKNIQVCILNGHENTSQIDLKAELIKRLTPNDQTPHSSDSPLVVVLRRAAEGCACVERQLLGIGRRY